MRELNYKKLLIIVDMVNGFVREGVMSDKYIEHIIPEHVKLINYFNTINGGLVFVKEAHKDNSNEFNKKISIIIPKNAVETYNGDNHNRDEYNNMAFKLLEQGGIKVVEKYGK